jgi:hypothetical protein
LITGISAACPLSAAETTIMEAAELRSKSLVFEVMNVPPVPKF